MQLNHEMSHMPPMGLRLLWAYQRALKPLGWELDSKRGGTNSLWMHHPSDPREFHFRWWKEQPDDINVFDAYRNAARLGVITVENDVARFVVLVTRTKKRWW